MNSPARQLSKSKGNEPRDQQPQIPWTATRCHRLLRPVSSRIAALRKEKKLVPVHTAFRSSPTQTSPVRLKDHHDIPGIVTVDGSKKKDPDWSPDERAKKKPRRTYSARHVGAQTKLESGISEVDGCGIGFDQASEDRFAFQAFQKYLMTRTKGGRSLYDSSDSSTSTSTLPINLKRSCPRLKPRTETSVLVDGLYNSLIPLLRATNKSKSLLVSKTGTKSLFTLCLEKVPVCIAEQQAWIEQEEPDSKEDAAEAMYAELENLSTSKEGGWAPLRKVVRAHGTHMIEMAIRDGTISPSHAAKFVRLFLTTGAVSQAGALGAAVLHSSYPVSSPGSFRPWPITSEAHGDRTTFDQVIWMSIFALSQRFNGSGFGWSTLAMMLEQDSIAVERIVAGSANGILSRALSCIATDSEGAVASLDFLMIFIWKSFATTSGRPEAAVQQLRFPSRRGRPRKGDRRTRATNDHKDPTVELDGGSIAKATFLISEVMAFACNHAGNTRVSGVIEALAVRSLQHHAIEDRSSTRSMNFHAEARRALPLLGFHLTMPICPRSYNDSSGLQTRFGTPPPDSDEAMLPFPLPPKDSAAKHSLASFVLKTALPEHGSYTLGGSCDAQFAKVKARIQRLLDLARIFPEAVSATDIALIAAFEFAESTQRPAHLNWAIELEEDVHRGVYDPPGELTRPLVDGAVTAGYRFEPSIGEWVTKTPWPRQKGPSVKPRPRVEVRIPVKRISATSGDMEHVETALPTPPSTPSKRQEEPTQKKRGRGRPRKSPPSPVDLPSDATDESTTEADQTSIEAELVSNEADETTELARGQGSSESDEAWCRSNEISVDPPQGSAEPDHDTDELNEAPARPKRPRGRPRKVPGGRGRPSGAKATWRKVSVHYEPHESSDDELGF